MCDTVRGGEVATQEEEVSGIPLHTYAWDRDTMLRIVRRYNPSEKRENSMTYIVFSGLTRDGMDRSASPVGRRTIR
ncbi:hypothetical protein DBA20_19890 [Pandoraea capi]|nr:hypothetical protein [Pandoraea sp. LA3]MDN4585240.1 hypothetical protein [Pandoraea capi]